MKQVKKFLLISLIGLMWGSVFSGCQEDNPVPKEETVKIGIFLSVTGVNGRKQMLGLGYALAKTPTIEIGGNTYKIRLIVAKNQTSTAAQNLVDQGVSIVLTSNGSVEGTTASGVFRDAGIAVIDLSNTTRSLAQGAVLAHLAQEKLAAAKAYVLAAQDDSHSMRLANDFMEVFGRNNCILEVSHESKSAFSSSVAAAKAQGSNVFFAPIPTMAAVQIIDQADAQDLGIPILASDAWDNNIILNTAKRKNVEIYITSFYHEGWNPKFDNGFKEWLNTHTIARTQNGGSNVVSMGSALGYDGFHLAIKTFKSAGSTNPAKIRDALDSVILEGATTPIAFTGAGNAVRNTVFVKKCNTETGAWESVAMVKAG